MGKRHNKSNRAAESPDEYSSDDECGDLVSQQFDPVLHSMLCERIPYSLGPNKEDDDGFTTVPSRSKKGPKHTPVPPKKSTHKRNPGNRLIPKRSEYNPEDVERFTESYKKYHYGMTGRWLSGFKLTPATHKYVTMMPHARRRNQILATLFDSRPKFWDLFGGSGADAISAMMDLDPEEIVCCNKSVPESVVNGPEYEQSLQEMAVLNGNIASFLKAYPELRGDRGDPTNGGIRQDGQPATRVKCKHTHAHTFIYSCPEGTEVDVVYLDPSWDDEQKPGSKDERKYEMQPKELFDHLEENIWGPIRSRKIKVGVYVIKTRWNWLKVQEYLPQVNNDYIAMYSVRAQPFRTRLDEFGQYGEVKGVYHFMILVHKQYKTVNAPNGQLYWDIVRNGVPVYVKRDTVIKVHKPEYSNQLSTPVFTESDPQNEAEYFKVEGASKHPRERFVEKHDKKKNASYDPNYFKVVPPPRDDRPDHPNRYDVLPADETERHLTIRI
jgi:hypothetical protein